MTPTHAMQHTFSYGLIYIYSIPGDQHIGRLKIGSATVTTASPTQKDIEAAAHTRIEQQTRTADIRYALEHAELAVTNEGAYFSDYDVHNVLRRSGYERKSENTKNAHSEWFEVDLATAINAIKAVKEGREALRAVERTDVAPPAFTFRPNQLEAIAQTSKAIRQNRKNFLWNAKMRFGKTSAAMQVAKVNSMRRVLIVTHRPSVSEDWYKDFGVVFAGTDYEYSSRTKGESLEKRLSSDRPFVYFASLQDLRLSEAVVSDRVANSKAKGFKKNQEIFDTTWDMLIVDEAHEGTQSNLGDVTLAKIPTSFTLHLSGTPFNILHKRDENEIYTWDYVMEQEEKMHWDTRYPGAPNPYAELPALSIFTYDVNVFADHIGDLNGFHDTLDGAFRFYEFFRVEKDSDGNDTDQFVHAALVNKFLDLLANDKLATMFPYATAEYRNYNKHALWLLPNRTKVIEAMEKLLKNHPVFGTFGIVNISGNTPGDDANDKTAKDRVTTAIRTHEYTITLTGQRLTTGASIPEWTAVFMLSDTSSATTYLQTAFRCQTPAKIGGMLKTQGYVFDFAPDRTLKLVAEAIELNHKSSKTNTPEQKQAMNDFLNFCPILAAKDGIMKPFQVGTMLEQLKKAIIERVSRNGFDDPKLYNDTLLQLDELDISKFNELKAIVGNSNTEQTNEIEINALGLDEIETRKAEDAERKKKQKKELTPDEKEQLQRLKEAREQKRSAISILRAVSIRMPMLVYGARVALDEDITLKRFIELVDDASWIEFMPHGLSKDMFHDFTKYYDEEVFRGVTRSIRAKAFDCDKLLPSERIQALATIFGTFKNPDKETVLTPWSTVNMHLGMTLGGNNFNRMKPDIQLPEWEDAGEPTAIWGRDDTKILEINSKSGVYPLLAAYNVYTQALGRQHSSEDEVYRELWSTILAKNIFVLCKSPMAVAITKRTLAGYTDADTNIIYIKDLVSKLKREHAYAEYDISRELQEKFGLEKGEPVKFTAIIGNPPYQQEAKGDSSSKDPLYHLFMEASYKLASKVTLITPARFLFNAGKTPKRWNTKMLHDTHLKVVYYEPNATKVFPNTDIKGGIAITYRDTDQDFGEIGVFTSFPELGSILRKVEARHEATLDKIISGRGVYRLTAIAHKEHPEIEALQSKGHKNDVGSGALKILKDVIFYADKPKDGKEYAQVLGILDNRRGLYWIDKRYLSRPKNFEKYKVILPKASGNGVLGEVLSSPIIGAPTIGFTETFIGIGAFDTEPEVRAALKYVKTRFVRTMLGIMKVTQDNPRDKWERVPLQNFTATADIDWSKPINEIDMQLYAKYALSEEEITFIESHAKAME